MSFTVIITDDDPVTLFLHQTIVKKSELSTEQESFSSGQETLDYLDGHCEDGKPYLILLDINMPLMTGWELLDVINTKPYSDQIYAVMVTSSIDRADHKKAKAYKQIIGYLEKPIQINRLQAFQTFFKDIQKRTF